MATETKYHDIVAWITVMLAGWADIIAAELINNGYTVGPAGTTGKVLSANDYAQSPSSLMAINISIPGDKHGKTLNEFINEIRELLKKKNIRAYSIICYSSKDGRSIWFGSNFELIKRRPFNPLKAEHLRLIEGGENKADKE